MVGLSSSDEMLEHVRRARTAKHILEDIHNVFQRHPLVNNLQARPTVYTVQIVAGRRMLSYINMLQHLGSILKSIDVDIDSKQIEISMLNVLSEMYENLTTALDVLGDDRKCFTLELVKGRLLQEERQRDMRKQNEVPTSDAAAKFGSSYMQKPSGIPQ